MVSQQLATRGGGDQGVSRLLRRPRGCAARFVYGACVGVPASSGYLLVAAQRRGRGFLAFAAGSRARRSSAAALVNSCTAARACALRAAAFCLAAPPSADRSSRPGSRNPMQACSRVRLRYLAGKGHAVRTLLAVCKTLAICRGRGVCDIFVAIPSSFNTVSVTTELLTTGLVGPLRSLSANSREQEYEQAATSCSHCNSLIQHAPLRYR